MPFGAALSALLVDMASRSSDGRRHADDLEVLRRAGGGLDAGSVHYFVNGGGGAYLSSRHRARIGPRSRRPPSGAFYPNRRRRRRGRSTRDAPGGNGLAWWWMNRHQCLAVLRPSTSGALRLQRGAVLSELRRGEGQPSAGRVRLVAYGETGRLTWNDLGRSDSLRTRGVAEPELVEWTMPMMRSSCRAWSSE